jgi:hypothetical protein
VQISPRGLLCICSALLASEVKIKSGVAWKQCFEKLLIPLLNSMSQIRPEKPTAADKARAAIKDQSASRLHVQSLFRSMLRQAFFDSRLCRTQTCWCVAHCSSGV